MPTLFLSLCHSGVYSADLRKHYDLKDPSWRYDIMPETVDGHNVADFIDPDIDAKLTELEREEEEAEAAHQAEVGGGVLSVTCCTRCRKGMVCVWRGGWVGFVCVCGGG